MEEGTLSHSDRELLRQISMDLSYGINSTRGEYIRIRKTRAQSIGAELMRIAD